VIAFSGLPGDFPSVMAESEALPEYVAVSGIDPFKAEALTIQPGSTATDYRFNWYSDREEANNKSVVQIIKKADMVGDSFPEAKAIIVNGTAGDASTGKSWHKAVVNGLDRNTDYAYRVSNNGVGFSEIYYFKTGAEGSFRFIAVGDPQLTTGNQDSDSIWPDPVMTTKAGWQDTLEKISVNFSDAVFIAGTGDQVDTATNEEQYANYFAPAQLRRLPVAPAVGNHEGAASNFGWHFNVPNQTPGANFGNYWYTYNNALFVVLNTSPYPKKTADSQNYISDMDATLAAAKAANPGVKWTFVQHHKSTASPASHQNDDDLKVWAPAFNALMDKHQVDFILAGHDHVYSRSWLIKDNKKVIGVDYSLKTVTDPDGALYFTLNTASGRKYYDFLKKRPSGGPEWVNDTTGLYTERKSAYAMPSGKPWYTNIGIQIKAPQFTIVDVTGVRVTFKTYRTDTMAAIDEYTVVKTGASSEPEPVVPTANVSEAALTEIDLFSICDVNRDRTVDLADLAAASYVFMAKSGDADWTKMVEIITDFSGSRTIQVSPKHCDINNNGQVDIEDLILIVTFIKA
jgi:hypothetical protein